MQFADANIHFDNHLNLSSFFTENQVIRILKSGYEPSKFNPQIKSNFNKQKMKFALGFHPWFVADHDEGFLKSELQKFELYVQQADAVGEVGLDYIYGKSHKQKQLSFINQVLACSQKHTKPVVLHVVRAHHDMLDALTNYGAIGYVHSFSGNLKQAQQYVDLGFKISISPRVMTQNSSKLSEVCKNIGIDHLLLESDADFKSLEGMVYLLTSLYEHVANIRGLNVNTLCDHIHANFQKVLGG